VGWLSSGLLVWIPLIETPPARRQECINIHHHDIGLDVSTPC
jgi:hypothetical protein